MLVTSNLPSANDGGNIQHQLVRRALLLKTAHVAFLPEKTVSSGFTGHRILTTILKNINIFFVIIIIIVLGKILERFFIGTDMLSTDRYLEGRKNNKFFN